MNKQLELLAKNLARSPIIPAHYVAQAITAIGGKVVLGEATSKQGGTNVQELTWENGEQIHIFSRAFDLEAILRYCKRNGIFYVICPALDEKGIMVYAKDMDQNQASVSGGATIEGTFMAALIHLRHKNKTHSPNVETNRAPA